MKAAALSGTLLALCVLLSACGGENTSSRNVPPGRPERAKTNVLETGSIMLQNRAPVRQLEIYLDGFHYAAGNLQDQMEAHHYCEKVNEDLTQCVLYDGNDESALMIGMEHIVSDKIFKTLPPEEQKLWHPHYYEVSSGTLIAPGLPEIAEHELMEEIYSTHGKTWHIWDTRKHKLPVGRPMLMMGFTRDGQLKQELVRDRDKRFNISTPEKRKERQDIPPQFPDTAKSDPLADQALRN